MPGTVQVKVAPVELALLLQTTVPWTPGAVQVRVPWLALPLKLQVPVPTPGIVQVRLPGEPLQPGGRPVVP